MPFRPAITTLTILKALKVRRLIKQDYDKAFEKVDVIATPTAPNPGFPLRGKDRRPPGHVSGGCFTVSINITGMPGLSVPCGMSSTGLPIGLQLIGKAFDEATLLRTAYAYEQATDWHKKKPTSVLNEGFKIQMPIENYEPVIGLEVHCELKTASKLFCGCSTTFGSDSNTQVCPVCLGLPGTLPVMNKKAVEYAVQIGLALNCQIAKYSKMDRKNYYYPDLPKAYQVSQYDKPLNYGGHLDIITKDGTKRIGVTRAHLEEDAGKLVHAGGKAGRLDSSDYSLADYNRGGIPLVEIVSEPDIRSADEAHAYLTALKSILLYIDVSDCNMEEGSLRCDANVSIRPKGTEKFGTRTEIKNMNSFKFAKQAIEYEIKRQAALLDKGERVVQESRLVGRDRKQDQDHAF